MKLTAFPSGGPFIDGLALSIIGIALITLDPAHGSQRHGDRSRWRSQPDRNLHRRKVFGYVTDKIGRHFMYIAR
jgi:putative MFS transporter